MYWVDCRFDYEHSRIEVNELSTSTRWFDFRTIPIVLSIFPSLAFRHRINKNKTWIRKKGFSISASISDAGGEKFAFCPFFCVAGAFNNTEQWNGRGKVLFVFRRESSPTDPFTNSVLCFVAKKNFISTWKWFPQPEWKFNLIPTRHYIMSLHPPAVHSHNWSRWNEQRFFSAFPSDVRIGSIVTSVVLCCFVTWAVA